MRQCDTLGDFPRQWISGVLPFHSEAPTRVAIGWNGPNETDRMKRTEWNGSNEQITGVWSQLSRSLNWTDWWWLVARFKVSCWSWIDGITTRTALKQFRSCFPNCSSIALIDKWLLCQSIAPAGLFHSVTAKRLLRNCSESALELFLLNLC